jgi:hypothetical protein
MEVGAGRKSELRLLQSREQDIMLEVDFLRQPLVRELFLIQFFQCNIQKSKNLDYDLISPLVPASPFTATPLT